MNLWWCRGIMLTKVMDREHFHIKSKVYLYIKIIKAHTHTPIQMNSSKERIIAYCWCLLTLNLILNTDLNVGTSVVVHGQRFSRTLPFVVAASDTCHHFRHPKPQMTLSESHNNNTNKQPTLSLSLSPHRFFWPYTKTQERQPTAKLPDYPSFPRHFQIFRKWNKKNKQNVCVCVLDRPIDWPDNHGTVVDLVEIRGSDPIYLRKSRTHRLDWRFPSMSQPEDAEEDRHKPRMCWSIGIWLRLSWPAQACSESPPHSSCAATQRIGIKEQQQFNNFKQ